MTHRELGARILEQLEKDLADVADVEMRPRMEGNQMFTIFMPKRHKSAKQQEKSREPGPGSQPERSREPGAGSQGNQQPNVPGQVLPAAIKTLPHRFLFTI